VARRVPAARVGPVLGGGITDEFFSSSRTLGPSAPAGRTEAPGPLRVLVVTRLDDLTYKGIDTCLDAIARSTADVELRIAGDGPAASALSTLVSTRGLERSVRQLGRVDDRVLRDEYARADVAVLLSRFRRGAAPMGEGLGIVPLEAGAAGTPAIVSSVGGTVDTVVDGVTGWLVDPDDVEGLAGLFEQLGLDRSIGMHRGEEARRFVRRVHSREAFRRRVGRAVEGVLGRSCAA
jgi:glycosyltransferase involved in cell wall biosynthesis